MENSKEKVTDPFLSLHRAIAHRKCEVLLTRESDSACLNLGSASGSECVHNGGLFFCRELRDYFE